jgi:ABC-2 type transport system ATP-binding protein
MRMEARVDVAPGITLAPVADTPVLHLSSISKAWGAKVVLDDITLGLAAGSLTWLAGGNGVGKTTLLRIASGLLAPDDGDVSLDGLHPLRNRREFRHRLGFLSAADRGIYARLQVHQHLALCARLALIPDSAVAPAIERIVDLVGIEELLTCRADRISMGQRQRLRVAMTFLHSPDLVLLDEPLTSLDEAGAAAVRRCIDAVLERSGAVLWCSPGTDGDQAAFDRRVRLEQGKLLEAG